MITAIVLLALAVALPAAVAAAPAVFYVAPAGNDAWSGTLPAPNGAKTDGPFATPQRARDAARAAKVTGAAPCRVVLRAGTYALAEPLVLGPEDSGTPEAPVTWEAFPGEKPVLSGGQTITGWRVQPGVSEVDLPEVKAGAWNFSQLWMAAPGQDWQRRYRPDRGAFIIAGLTDAPTAPGATMAHRRSQDEFRFFPGDIERFPNPADVEVVALHDWSSSRLRIREVDLQNHVVKFTGFPVYRIGAWWKGGRNPYFVENGPWGRPGDGRFALDRPAGRLRYGAGPDEDLNRMSVIAPRLAQLLQVRGDLPAGRYVEHVRFRGVGFQHTNWLLPAKGYSSGQGMVDLPAAVDLAAARDCRFEGCTFAHLGAYALRLGQGCHDNQVVGNRIYDLGGGGILVGVTDAKAVEPAVPTGNEVGNNLVSDGGLIHYSAHGIWIGMAQRTRVHHNVVRRFLYSNVSCGWAWNDQPSPCRDNVVEFNHIHDAMMLLADGGGFYSLGFQPGMLLRGNLVHDVHRSRFAGSAPNNGLFLDQGSKAFAIEENVIYNTSGKPVRHNQNEPAGHTWTNNSLGVAPDDANFPKELAARAGLEPAWRHLLAEPMSVPPAPILAMSLPDRVIPIAENFEKTAVGARPSGLTIQGEDEAKGATIRVTDETAASGTRSLKYVDRPGMAKPFYPYCFFEPGFTEGMCRITFAVRREADAVLQIEGRDVAGGVLTAGPSLSINADGQMKAGDTPLATIPAGVWTRVEIRVGLGKRADGRYTVTVTGPDGAAQRFPGLPCAKPAFRKLDWLGFISQAQKEQTAYLDDVAIAVE